MGSIRGKMLIWFGLTLVSLLALLGVVNHIQVRDTVIPLTKELSAEVLVARSAEIGRLIQGYSNDIQTLSMTNLIRKGTWDEIKADLLNRAGEIHEDYEILFFADTKGDFITTIGVEGHVGDRDYFVAIMENGVDHYISNVMVSRSTGEDIFVVANVVLNKEGERKGVVASTVLLETLSRIVGSIDIGKHGFGFVVDHHGLLIAHPDETLRMQLNLLESSSLGYQGLEEAGQAMAMGKSGVTTYVRPNGSKLVAIYNPIPHTPAWSLGISIPEEELLGTAFRLTRNIGLMMIAIVIAVLLIVIVVSGKIASPIMKLKEGAIEVSTGNLDHILDIRTNDEIEELADSFNAMTKHLKTYMINLQKTTAVKERIEGELHIANKIQSSMLPKLFPPYPNISNLGLYATMEPAREVGGDFYDFFVLDDNRLCFAIGDVSGKGIPAALFMVITRTILKNQALQGLNVSEIFYHTNNMLCSDNDEHMFVTAFMGIIDCATGELEYVCAGHNPPLISVGGKDFEYLNVGKSLVLGGMPDYPYKVFKTVIKPGDALYLYTDGVTEAMDAEGALFTDQRMFDAINRIGTTDVKAILKGMREALDQFVKDTPASDDVTMLALTLMNETFSGES